MKEKAILILRSKWVLACLAFLLGAFVILGIRFVTYRPADDVHYHANFAVYINGQRELFKNPFYYTDVEEMCTAGQNITPHERAHMHDNVYDVVHVEDHAVTWSQFFQNLGWVVDADVIRTPDNLYLADSQHPITFMLNGQTVPNITQIVIGDKDKLLVSYGTTDQTELQNQYNSIASTAAHYDTAQDPPSCSGSKKVTLSERMHHLF